MQLRYGRAHLLERKQEIWSITTLGLIVTAVLSETIVVSPSLLASLESVTCRRGQRHT